MEPDELFYYSMDSESLFLMTHWMNKIYCNTFPVSQLHNLAFQQEKKELLNLLSKFAKNSTEFKTILTASKSDLSSIVLTMSIKLDWYSNFQSFILHKQPQTSYSWWKSVIIVVFIFFFVCISCYLSCKM